MSSSVGRGQAGAKVYAALKGAILAGNIVPGAALREEELSARFDVSRTPVREALKKLEAEGLVAHEGRTLVVARPTLDEVIDSYEIRANLAGLAARLAAERATESDFVELEVLQNRSERNGASSRQIGLAMTDFDRAVWKASKNPGLAKLLEELQSWENRFTGRTLNFPGRLRASVAEHRALLIAIRRRDPAQAEHLSVEHTRHSRDTRIKMTLERPSRDTGSATQRRQIARPATRKAHAVKPRSRASTA